MRRGLLLIDRGSREEEVKEELQYICEKVKLRGNYYFSDYCFLEVVPPYIADGIKKCLSQNIDALTIIPYFLYPGRKVKAAVNTAVRLQSQTGVKFTISRPMATMAGRPWLLCSKRVTACSMARPALGAPTI